MNIYLDIDGVILGTKSPQKDVVKLIKYILKHYPNSTYWLTTHCKGGVNRCAEWLKQSGFPVDLVNEMDKRRYMYILAEGGAPGQKNKLESTYTNRKTRSITYKSYKYLCYFDSC